MATYTNPSSLNTGPGDPITSEIGTASLENPVAITEGATGAPRSVLKSFERLFNGTQVRSETTVSTSGTGSIVDVHSFGFLQIGTVNCYMNRTSGSGELTIVRTRADADLTVGSTTLATLSVDVDVIPGDLVTFRVDDSGGGKTVVSQIRTAGQNLWPGTGVSVVDNDV